MQAQAQKDFFLDESEPTGDDLGDCNPFEDDETPPRTQNILDQDVSENYNEQKDDDIDDDTHSIEGRSFDGTSVGGEEEECDTQSKNTNGSSDDEKNDEEGETEELQMMVDSDIGYSVEEEEEINEKCDKNDGNIDKDGRKLFRFQALDEDNLMKHLAKDEVHLIQLVNTMNYEREFFEVSDKDLDNNMAITWNERLMKLCAAWQNTEAPKWNIMLHMPSSDTGFRNLTFKDVICPKLDETSFCYLCGRIVPPKSACKLLKIYTDVLSTPMLPYFVHDLCLPVSVAVIVFMNLKKMIHLGIIKKENFKYYRRVFDQYENAWNLLECNLKVS